MNKLFFLFALFFMMFVSCTRKKTIIGKWQMIGNGPIINFINDSLGYIEHSDTIALPKKEEFKYHMKEDTLFEDKLTHLDGRRKWVISKLTEDSLIIHCNGIYARYYKLQ